MNLAELHKYKKGASIPGCPKTHLVGLMEDKKALKAKGVPVHV